MDKHKTTQALMSLSAVSVLIGLALFGIAFGYSLKSELTMREHMLFIPGIFCVAVGSFSILITMCSNSNSGGKSHNQ